MDSNPDLDSLGAELWKREVSGAEVEAWFLLGEGRSPESPGPALMFFHGNAESIDEWPVWLRPFQERGVSLLLMEYRGYGRSTGERG